MLEWKFYLGQVGVGFKCRSTVNEKAGVFNDVVCEICLKRELLWRENLRIRTQVSSYLPKPSTAFAEKFLRNGFRFGASQITRRGRFENSCALRVVS